MGTVERVELVGKLPVFVDGSLQRRHDGIDGGLALDGVVALHLRDGLVVAVGLPSPRRCCSHRCHCQEPDGCEVHWLCLVG